MKAKYEKPEIYIEDFTLNQTIASCGKIGQTTHYTPNVCGYKVGDLVLWSESISDCTDSDMLDDPDSFGDICYHTHSPENVLFSS